MASQICARDRSIEIKEQERNAVFLLEKDRSKVENKFLQRILQKIFENQMFQRMAKFIMVDFYKMDFVKGIVILVKVDKMCNILISPSHCLLVEG